MMPEKYRINEDSFGTELPDNWKEIANYLNGILERQWEKSNDDDREHFKNEVEAFWERYCTAMAQDAPDPTKKTEPSREAGIENLEEASEKWERPFKYECTECGCSYYGQWHSRYSLPEACPVCGNEDTLFIKAVGYVK